jgi:hypothetical protein
MSEYFPVHTPGEEDPLPPNAEAYLQQRLIEAASLIAPRGDYVMTLSGISASRPEHKALAAHAANLTFRSNPDGTVSLSELRLPLEGQSSASLVIYRTEKSGFITAIETNERMSNTGIIGTEKNAAHNFEVMAMGAFSITPPPTTSRFEYQTWRAGLLARTHAWSIREQMTVAEQLASEDTHGAVTLLREERYGYDAEPSVLSTIRRTVSLYPQEDESSEHFHEELTVEERFNEDRTFGIVQRHETHTVNPFIVNDMTIEETRRLEVPLTSDSFNRFDWLLEYVGRENAKEVQP